MKTLEIKQIATIHSAIHLAEADFFMFDEDCGITEDEEVAILNEIKVIAKRLLGNHPSKLSSTKDIIEYVKELNK